MGILVSSSTNVLVQGITGRLGSRQTKLMLDYGTKIVAGVTPGKGGETVFGVPVYDSVEEATCNHRIDASVLYVPAPFLKEAAFETMDAKVPFMVLITDWVPVHDAIEIKEYAKKTATRYIGPNCPGIIVPGQTSLGMMPPSSVSPGRLAVISRSGTLTGEITLLLTYAGVGQSLAVGVGGDPVVGMRFIELIEMLEQDDHTSAVLMIGEIGGTMEEEAAAYLASRSHKPVISFIAGKSAPREKRMGHAGAIVSGGRGTAESKIESLRRAGVRVAETPFEIPDLAKQVLNAADPP
jgi:succinyl-CoA synthetase alpha subunit